MIWVQHLPSLRAFAMSLTRNRSSADDLVQDTIVKAWTNFEKFTQGTNLHACFSLSSATPIIRRCARAGARWPTPKDIHAQGLYVNPDHDGRLAYRDFQRAFDQPVRRTPRGADPGRRVGLFLRRGGRANGRGRSAPSKAVPAARVARLCELLGLAAGEDILDEARSTLAVMGRSGMQAA